MIFHVVLYNIAILVIYFLIVVTIAFRVLQHLLLAVANLPVANLENITAEVKLNVSKLSLLILHYMLKFGPPFPTVDDTPIRESDKNLPKEFYLIDNMLAALEATKEVILLQGNGGENIWKINVAKPDSLYQDFSKLRKTKSIVPATA